MLHLKYHADKIHCNRTQILSRLCRMKDHAHLYFRCL